MEYYIRGHKCMSNKKQWIIKKPVGNMEPEPGRW